jgi:hypothetical protein
LKKSPLTPLWSEDTTIYYLKRSSTSLMTQKLYMKEDDVLGLELLCPPTTKKGGGVSFLLPIFAIQSLLVFAKSTGENAKGIPSELLKSMKKARIGATLLVRHLYFD